MTTRDQMRAAAPELADFVDGIRTEFGPVKITYLRIDAIGVELGIPIDPTNLVEPSDTTPTHVIPQQAEEQLKRDIEAHKRLMGTTRKKR